MTTIQIRSAANDQPLLTTTIDYVTAMKVILAAEDMKDYYVVVIK